MYNNYSLNIVSRLKDFDGKSLKKYKVAGIDTIGAWGNEPFEIHFKNNTYQKIQVKLSMDGTDILSGEQATSEPTGKMWVVGPYENLVLKAWPESNNGGAGFVFTSGDKSVALHTHGDMSHRGIIAAAVFTEGHVEPVRINHVHHHHYDWWTKPYYLGGTFGDNTGYYGSNSGNYKGMSSGTQTRGLTSSNSLSFNSCVDAIPAANSLSESDGLESLASVGAGSYVEQQITYTTGLIKPLLSETVRVKYVWWDDLVSALKKESATQAHPSGFPADKPLMSLGSTPRQETNQTTARVQEQQFARV